MGAGIRWIVAEERASHFLGFVELFLAEKCDRELGKEIASGFDMRLCRAKRLLGFDKTATLVQQVAIEKLSLAVLGVGRDRRS